MAVSQHWWDVQLSGFSWTHGVQALIDAWDHIATAHDQLIRQTGAPKNQDIIGDLISIMSNSRRLVVDFQDVPVS
jgi:hypothetical protein